MGRPRIQFQRLLETLGAVQVYFQPPNGPGMKYPCIVYERDDSSTQFADNIKYRHTKRYTVTVIDRDPDSLIPDRVEALPLSSFSRAFTADNLNHSVFNVYF